VIGGPVVVEAGKTTRLDFTLPPTAPGGNLVENPDGRLSYLVEGTPDRWNKGAGNTWTSAKAVVAAQTTYRCGAVLRDPKAKVRFQFQPAPKGGATAVNLDLPAGELQPAEARQAADADHPTVVVIVTKLSHITSSRDAGPACPRIASGRTTIASWYAVPQTTASST
jgi:hypothetical protein